jgi:ABC-type Mn2+/Zn2+ transport system ATPase subunit
MTNALDLVNVTAGYGDNPIVHDFSARLTAGSITTLIGGNGAGKSTLLRAIYGTNRFFSGQIVFKGEAVEKLPPWERLKRGIGFVPESFMISVMPLSTPSSGARGVVSTLVLLRLPFHSRQRSVKVPPISTAKRAFSIVFYAAVCWMLPPR